MSNLTQEEEAASFHTFRHIETVRNYLNRFVTSLLRRGEKHDQSKLENPEVELFTEMTPILSKLTFGSPEYDESKAKLGPALEHHYAKNRHHPEHWPSVDSKEADLVEEHIKTLNVENQPELVAILSEHVESLRSPLNNMSLLDHCEMLCDWKASSERHNDGNIRKSIKHNARRFGMSPQLINIYEATLEVFTDDDK